MRKNTRKSKEVLKNFEISKFFKILRFLITSARSMRTSACRIQALFRGFGHGSVEVSGGFKILNFLKIFKNF